MLSERLKIALKEAGMRPAELARRCGVKPPSVAGWLSGKSKFLRGENLLSAARVLNVSQIWLATGKGPMRQNHTNTHQVQATDENDDNPHVARIRKVKMKLSAGISGFAIEPDYDNECPVYLPKSLIASRGYKIEQLLAITISGQSMEPSLNDGDIVVINTADTEPKDGLPFAINYEGEAVVKRMVRDSGTWWLSSDNPDKRRFPLKQCSGDDCIVIGRVVHKQSETV